jgi:hypothetical protein
MAGEERDPRQRNYEIRVRGHLGAAMLRAFPALAARTRGTIPCCGVASKTRPRCTA